MPDALQRVAFDGVVRQRGAWDARGHSLVRGEEPALGLSDLIQPLSGFRISELCLAAPAGRDPRWIADQIGHTSAVFTLQVYQQTRNCLTDCERQAIWELMRFADASAECPFTRQVTCTDDPRFRPVNGPAGGFSRLGESDGIAEYE